MYVVWCVVYVCMYVSISGKWMWFKEEKKSWKKDKNNKNKQHAPQTSWKSVIFKPTW